MLTHTYRYTKRSGRRMDNQKESMDPPDKLPKLFVAISKNENDSTHTMRI